MIFSSFFRIRVTTGIALLVLLCAGHTVAQSYTIAGVAVSATSGLPLSGTAVRLAAQSSGATLGTRITGKDGGFRFEPLAAGKYQLRGMRRGFLPTEYEQHGDFSSAVVTGPAQETMHLLLRMAPEAELHGVVTGEESEPVEGATVMLFRCPDPHQPGRKIEMLDTVKADDTGAYVFSHLRPGEYRLTVKGEPWFAVPRTSSTSGTRALDLAYPLTYFDGATSEVTAAPILLEAGSREQADVRLQALPALRIAISKARDHKNSSALLRQSAFGFQLPDDASTALAAETPSATVYSHIAPGRYDFVADGHILAVDAASDLAVDPATGTPAANLTGTVESAPGVEMKDLALLTLEPAQAGSDRASHTVLVQDGHFSAENIPAGPWRLKLENGYGHALTIASVAQNGKSRAGNLLPLGGGTVTLTVRASLGTQTIEGFVRSEGKTAAGTMVVLVPDDLTQHPQRARRDQTDSDGSFLLRDVVPGRYTVIAIEQGWTLDWENPATIARYLPAGQRVTVQGGSGQTIRLPAPVASQPL